MGKEMSLLDVLMVLSAVILLYAVVVPFFK